MGAAGSGRHQQEATRLFAEGSSNNESFGASSRRSSITGAQRPSTDHGRRGSQSFMGGSSTSPERRGLTKVAIALQAAAMRQGSGFYARFKQRYNRHPSIAPVMDTAALGLGHPSGSFSCSSSSASGEGESARAPNSGLAYAAH